MKNTTHHQRLKCVFADFPDEKNDQRLQTLGKSHANREESR